MHKKKNDADINEKKNASSTDTKNMFISYRCVCV